MTGKENKNRLLPWQRVLTNVELGLLGSKNYVREIALQVLRSVGLEDRANEWPAVLSGGQRQRVALARALGGRLLINVVTGGDPVELAGDGLHLSHDDRSLRLFSEEVYWQYTQLTWRIGRSLCKNPPCQADF